MKTLKTYYTNYNKFLKGEMSLADWKAFTDEVSQEILNENKDALTRLGEGVKE